MPYFWYTVYNFSQRVNRGSSVNSSWNICIHIYCINQFSSVAQSCPTLCDPMDCNTPGLAVISSTPGVYSKSCPLSWWCHPTISSSVIPFSSCLQSSPAPGSFQMSQFVASGGQSIGVTASASVLPMNIQDWFPLGWIGWISLLSPCSQESSPTPQFKSINFFGSQLSLESNSHIHTWLLEKL